MKILAIDTSCDETAVAITEGRRVLAQTSYSQILMHNEWGGVVPSLAKRAHEQKSDYVIENALKKFMRQMDPAPRQPLKSSQETPRILWPPGSRHPFGDIDYIAVTCGPGLAIALEVGIKKAKELAIANSKQLIAINHMEGHIYSVFAQNSKGNPDVSIQFPYLALLVSGGHTEFVLFKDHISYEIIGKSLDDAAGEALDKSGRLLGLGYPAGPVIERLAGEVGNIDTYKFPRPMARSPDLNFSFSGLKTAFYYYVRELGEREKGEALRELASSFQEAVFDSLLQKTEKAITQTGVKNLIVAGGVAVNQRLRLQMRQLAKTHCGGVLFPPFKYLNGDNAVMIGIAAHYKAEKNLFVENLETLDREPRLSL